ncbi:MAG: SAM-dependent DNA methyltransferase [Desulfobacteraceae bacterium]|nr:SAM-dependent DNA methyltransferase [Desulfobacteraceae bacterium]
MVTFTQSMQHIDKIIDTYQYRKEEERYSRCVSMEEIEKNEYNLNISRYVSTAEPEPIIDIGQVNKELAEIEKTITKAKNTHNKFLKELGLAVLP